jgi:aspartokinase/homoserine dehydrogenase 1
VQEFLARLSEVDSWFEQRIRALRSEGKVLRYAASITGPVGAASVGAASVGALEVPVSDPLAAIRNGENAFVFTTRYYSPIPLVIRGYGAGADVTASGVFADILRTTTW